MRKIFTFIAVMALATVASMASTFTFTSAESVNQIVDGYSVKIEKGSGNNAPAYYDNGLRLYANNTITISGADLTRIELTFSMQGSKAYADLTCSPGTLVSGGASSSQTDLKTDTWTGNATSVTFTLGASGQRLINKIVVNGDGSDGGNTGGGNDNPSGPTVPDTPSLNPDYIYAEPTVMKVPSITVQGAPYTFIDNNIEVSCTKGAITDSYFSAHAGFSMTFTATKNIKGIVINGFVKKDFTATADHGKISYLTPDEDREANPVVVITDVNSRSVTIDCVKQLRCYNVEVYFDENPEVTVTGSGSGEEITLSFDSADAVYESYYSEQFGEPNYSIFLFNESTDTPYFVLDLYPASVGNLVGTYTFDDRTLGEYTCYVYGYKPGEISFAEDGEVIITISEDNYTIMGTLICDDSNTYTIRFSGKMPFYTDDEYYDNDREFINLDFAVADAVYESKYSEQEGKVKYSVFLYSEETSEIPYLAFDLYPSSKYNLAGIYTFGDGNLGEDTYYVYGYNEGDIIFAKDADMIITESDGIYSIIGVLYDENINVYNVRFSGKMNFYTDDEYYGGNNVLMEIVSDESDADAPAYDLQGRSVGKDYRGIYIRNGKKYIGR